MTSLKVRLPYIVWRDGRPRWVPGPRLRGQGLRSKDLRHDDGRWFSLEEAEAYSLALLAKHKSGSRTRLMSGPPRTGVTGFIYFLWSGNFVKIGYSRGPLRRAEALLTGLAQGVRAFAAVPGSRADERRLHHALTDHRSMHGEWFTTEQPVLDTMTLSIICGRPTTPCDHARKSPTDHNPKRSHQVDFSVNSRNF
mgnify:CR=1 FL=1